MKLWSGRFQKDTDALVNDFNASIAFDSRLYREDISGSVAHAAMLGEQGSLCFDGAAFHKFGVVSCPKVVDSMGAGDSYIAGFLTGIIGGAPVEKAMEMGAAAATETLQYFGAW